jgi:hypothetical protein
MKNPTGLTLVLNRFILMKRPGPLNVPLYITLYIPPKGNWFQPTGVQALPGDKGRLPAKKENKYAF